MKNKGVVLYIGLLFLLSSSLVSAVEYPHGPYAAISVGRGYTNFSKNNFSSNLHGAGSDAVWGGRLSMGFNIDRYFGIEAGYQRFQQRKFGGLNNNGNGKVDEQAFDIQTVLRMPLWRSLDVFAKLGPAYVDANQQADAGTGTSRHIKTWRPRYAVGVEASFPNYPGLSFTASYSRITKKNDKHLPNAELYAVGVMFHF